MTINPEIWTALISVISVVVTAVIERKLTMAELDKRITVIDEKIKVINKRLENHNHFAEMFASCSEDIAVIKEQMKYIQK